MLFKKDRRNSRNRRSSDLMQLKSWVLSGLKSRQCQWAVRFGCYEGAGTADIQLFEIAVVESLMVALFSLMHLAEVIARTG